MPMLLWLLQLLLFHQLYVLDAVWLGVAGCMRSVAALKSDYFLRQMLSSGWRSASNAKCESNSDGSQTGESVSSIAWRRSSGAWHTNVMITYDPSPRSNVKQALGRFGTSAVL